MKDSLILVSADEDGTSYQYSDELFDWFYSKVKYYQYYGNIFENFKSFFNYNYTKKDHQENGCRIYNDRHEYVKLYETSFLMSFDEKELNEITSRYGCPSVEDIVDYFYKEVNKKK